MIRRVGSMFSSFVDRLFQYCLIDDFALLFSKKSENGIHVHLVFHLDRYQPSYIQNKILPDRYPMRSNSTHFNPELSRALRIDASLLAIIRIDDKRSSNLTLFSFDSRKKI